ncbi:MAG TPA: glycosyltransferase family 9 protein [Candidatus Wallbacteria bacterium]|nr:glycosyltransferase family 9 protein [Candidatus Wallbacteria bacterium]
MKVLLIRLRSIGDIIQCTPAFAAAREILKNSSIDLMVDERFADLVIENPSIDGFLLYNNQGEGFLQKLKYDLRFLKIIRNRRYDMVIDFHGIPKTAWLSYLSGAKIRLGYNYAGRGHLYTHRLEPPQKFKVHSARNQINLLKTLPEEFRPPAKLLDDFKLETFIAADHSRKAFESFLADNGIAAETPAEKIIIYHITPSNNFKKWHAENYAALINMCERHPALSKYSITHIVIGRAEDDKEFEKINSAVKTVRGKIISACGRLSLGAVYNLAKASSCFVGPDSGPLHIASAAGILTIGLFGPTNVETFAPPSGNFHGVYNPDLTCRPCDQKRCANNFKCIKSIKASDVFYAMLKNILK